MNSIFALGLIASPVAYVVIGLVAVLLFGNKLPSIARSMGSSFIEFKKGISGIEDEVKDVTKTINNEFKY